MVARVFALLFLVAVAANAKKTEDLQIDCDLVLCDVPPICANGVPTVPLGGCCPTCAVTAAPETKQPTESEEPTETEKTKLTEALPSTSTEPVTEKPCEIKGSKPVQCAPSCPATCLSPFVFCDSIVCDIPGMCACPDGQVIDEVNSRCVPRDECPSATVTAASSEPGTVEPDKKTEEEDDKEKDSTPDPSPDNKNKTKPIAGSGDEPGNITETKHTCSVEGAVYSKCGGGCPLTCGNPYIICLIQGCFPGCMCPNGQLIDEAKKRCVPREQCPSPVLPTVPEPSSSPKPKETEPPASTADPLQCPPGVAVSLCKDDPCNIDSCPAYPNATCRANFCGGCFARFFVGDDEVTDNCSKPDSSGLGVSKPELLCAVEGAVYSKCGAACPPTCLAPYLLCLFEGCFPGCMCPDGQLIDGLNNRCVPHEQCSSPAVPTPVVSPEPEPETKPEQPTNTTENPCAVVDCAPGYRCEVYVPTLEAICAPYCELENGGCPLNQRCQLRQVQCSRNPCPPAVECLDMEDEPATVPPGTKPTETATVTSNPETSEPESPTKPEVSNKTKPTVGTQLKTDPTTAQVNSTSSPCPPTCSLKYCSQSGNRNALCTVPGPREIPGCTGECQLTLCKACYNSESDLAIPSNSNCQTCSDYTTASSCFRNWATCVRRAHIAQYGKLPKKQRTETNFRCHKPSCNLRG